jgi:hypothetical protein
MANFDDQIMGMTGLTISGSSTTPSQAEVKTFLNDGVLDVTHKCIDSNPREAINFSRVSAEQTANDTLDLNGAEIISVIRESSVNNQWEECRFVPPSMQFKVTDKESLDYASEFNPVYTVLENGIINVYPAPDTGGAKSFKVYYVNNAPEEGDGTDLEHSSSTIKYFPNDKIYLVVIYAAIKCLEAKMADYTVEEEDSELVQSISNSLVNLKQQYENAFTNMYDKQNQGGR